MAKPEKLTRIEPFFRWYDLWVGMYIDTKNNVLYICPLPMIGVKVNLKRD